MIYKYPLEGLLVNYYCTVKMPLSADIKHVGMQNSLFGQGLMAWAEVDEREAPIERELVLIPTGGNIPLDAKYIRTVELDVGTIYHIYTLPVVLKEQGHAQAVRGEGPFG